MILQKKYFGIILFGEDTILWSGLTDYSLGVLLMFYSYETHRNAAYASEKFFLRTLNGSLAWQNLFRMRILKQNCSLVKMFYFVNIRWTWYSHIPGKFPIARTPRSNTLFVESTLLPRLEKFLIVFKSQVACAEHTFGKLQMRRTLIIKVTLEASTTISSSSTFSFCLTINSEEPVMSRNPISDISFCGNWQIRNKELMGNFRTHE